MGLRHRLKRDRLLWGKEFIRRVLTSWTKTDRQTTDGQTDGWKDGQTDGWTDKNMAPAPETEHK